MPSLHDPACKSAINARLRSLTRESPRKWGRMRGPDAIGGPWPEHPTLGRCSGEVYSRLHAKHLNHHLTQFGA